MSETIEASVRGVNTSPLLFLATVAAPLVVYAGGLGVWEALASAAGVLLGQGSYIRYRRVRTG
ncbi:hypothetical protein ACTWP5_24050 [Streptomyces sp. 4N509B]|uniref:hypothetical protein n=1 Tax=Streptomyces sp. 4N509B TaxID=3457413 RepID=UPI003FD3F5AB